MKALGTLQDTGVSLSRRIWETISSDFWSIVLPSYLTKLFGRLMMVLGVIKFTTFMSFLTFNLAYAAPFVALLAGSVEFAIHFYKAYREGNELQDCLLEGFKAFAKTFIKFFVVYMFWTVAMGLAISFGWMSGPMLIVGLLFVGLGTAMGLLLATAATDILPSGDFSISHIRSVMVKAFVEGFTWALMEHLSICHLLPNVTGAILDIIAVSVVVSTSYLMAGVLDILVVSKVEALLVSFVNTVFSFARTTANDVAAVFTHDSTYANLSREMPTGESGLTRAGADVMESLLGEFGFPSLRSLGVSEVCKETADTPAAAPTAAAA
jgi:hypothetical protein